MINQVKQLTHGLLTAGLLGCGVASEVATRHPSAAPVSSVATEPVGERPAQVPSRPDPAAPAASAVVLTAKAPGQLAAVAARRPAPPTATATTLPLPNANEPALGAANRRVQSGRIIDEAGAPLVGATVLLKGTGRGTSTDANGDYSLPVPLGTNTFVFAYSGYQDEVAQSRDGQPLTVTLLPVPGLAPAAPEPKTRPRPAKAHGRKVPR